MNPVPMHGDLQIDQDLRFSRREWRTQHIGWLTMVLFVIAATLGLMGRGTFSHVRERTADERLGVDYHRVTRHSAPDVLFVELAPTAVTNGTVQLWFDRKFIQGRTVESIAPEPERSSASGDRIIYEFHIADPTRATVIAFHMQPDEMWRQPSGVGLVGGDSVRVAQFVLP